METLRLIARQFEGFERSFARQVEAFAGTHPGLTVDVTFQEISDLERAMVYGEREVRYDLLLAVTDWLPKLIGEGRIQALDGYLAHDAPPDWPGGWAESMRRLQTTPTGIYGIPYHDGPEIFMYRRDLFEDPEEQQAFLKRFGYPLRPPEDWNRFVDVATFFTRPDEGLWGSVVAAYPDAHNNVYDFLIQLWSRGGQLLSGRRAAFDNELGREALQFYVDLFERHRVVAPLCRRLDSVASGEFFAGGNAAMMWNWSGFAAVADGEGSQVRGKVLCSRIPSGSGPAGRSVSLNVYWVLTIPSDAPNPGAAWEFIRHCATPEMDRVTSLAGGNGTRLSTWRDPSVRRRFPYYEVIEEIHGQVCEMPALPELPDVSTALSDMVTQALDGQDVGGVVSQAARRINRVLGG